jgi:hypothetical protein
VSEIVATEGNFLMADGEGDPNHSAEFQTTVEALFSLSYSIKFYVKKLKAIDYGVLPLEGLWWADDMSDFNSISGDRNNWKWTLMIRQPNFINLPIVEENRESVAKKKKLDKLAELRFEKFTEGKAVQIMHIGPFSEEGKNVEKLHQYIYQKGNKIDGKHHEIYLSDFRKVDPQKMKTILRQPYREA